MRGGIECGAEYGKYGWNLVEDARELEISGRRGGALRCALVQSRYYGFSSNILFFSSSS